MALFAVIGVSLMSSFSMGMRVWKRSADVNIMYRKAVINLERLGQELRAGVNYPYIGFFGSKDHIEFAALLRDKITNVSYAYAPHDKAVSRHAVTMQAVLELEEPTPARKVVTGVDNMSFSYGYFDVNSSQYLFLDDWNYTKNGIPLAVKAALTLEGGETFEKTVFIPISQ